MSVDPTPAQVAALAQPGDDWPTGTDRARRLLNAVCECSPCPMCAPGGEFDWPDQVRGWVDDGEEACEACRCYESSCRLGDPDDYE